MHTQHLKLSFLAGREDFKPSLCVGVPQLPKPRWHQGTRVAAGAQGHLLQPQAGSHCGVWVNLQGQGYQNHLQELLVLGEMGEV